jgi:hypothetical protein
MNVKRKRRKEVWMRIEPLNQTHQQSTGGHNIMPQTSDRLLLSSRFGINVSKQKLICDANGCNKPAADQVTVSVGRFGDIDLNLCNSCKPIFKNTDKLTALPKRLTFGRMADPDGTLLSTT